MEACWHLKSMKKRDQLRKAILLDLYVFPRRESFFFFIILEVEVGRKIGLKSMKIPSQDGRASWHRFLNDFD